MGFFKKKSLLNVDNYKLASTSAVTSLYGQLLHYQSYHTKLSASKNTNAIIFSVNYSNILVFPLWQHYTPYGDARNTCTLRPSLLRAMCVL